MNLQLLDWIIIAVYAVSIVTVGMLVSRKPQGSEGYFLAGRKLRWPFIGASMFASNISAEHFVGLAGSGFALGMAIGGFEWMAVFCMAPLIFIFLPFYIKNKIYTVPEFLEKRFGPSVRMTFSGFMVVLTVLAKVSISLYASSVIFSKLLGFDDNPFMKEYGPLLVIWGVGLVTAIYTMKGGLKAVVYTDAIQTTVLLAAAIVLVLLGLQHVGGWSGLKARIDPEFLSMVKPATHKDVPWPGMFISVLILGSFYWSMDQVLVQRVFAAKSLNEGRLGATFCAFLKISTPFLLVLPGLFARVLYPNLAKSDEAYPELLKNLMPTGLLGLTIAGIAAALMGHLSATYNSVATLFTRDFYLKFRPNASQERQILVGRIAVMTVFALGALWAPIINHFESLWIYLQSVQAYLMMPFAGIFFVGVFWKRLNAPGVLACVATAMLISPVFMYNSQLMDQGRPPLMEFLAWPLLRPWLHTATLSFVICLVVMFAVTVMTSPVPAEKLQNTTITWGGGAGAELVKEKRPMWSDYRLWFTAAMAMTAGLWYVMR